MPFIERFRQPEYTGENRCLPCTIVNVMISSFFSTFAVVSIYLIASTHILIALATGSGIFIFSLIMIYLRGYLVPGTPTFTKRYLPNPILRLFDKSSITRQIHSGGEQERWKITIETEALHWDGHVTKILQQLGALKKCTDKDDLCLTEDFKEQWNSAIENVDSNKLSSRGMARKFGLSKPSEYSLTIVDENDVEGHLLSRENIPVGQWPSRAALVADFAALSVFEDMIDGWEDVNPDQRGKLTQSLRLFIEECPTAEGPVTIQEGTRESCCSENKVIAVVCTETGDRLMEQPLVS